MPENLVKEFTGHQVEEINDMQMPIQIPKGMIKHDNNFIDKPLWFLSHASTSDYTTPTIIDANGYVFKANYKVPNFTDIVVLFYCMKRSQEMGYVETVELSVREILVNCGIDTGHKAYMRIMESLKTWKGISIDFSGTFFDGNEYESIQFQIIDSFHVTNNKRLRIEFNKNWLACQKKTNYFTFIDFSLFKSLKFSSARRLYELLARAFKDTNKLTLTYRECGKILDMKPKKNKNGDFLYYRSDIIRDLAAPLNAINSLCLSPDQLAEMGIVDPFGVKIETDREHIIFVKINISRSGKIIKSGQKAHWAYSKDETFQKILSTAGQPVSNVALDALARHYEKNGAEYIQAAINYANRTCDNELRFSYYLIKVLEKGWADD